MSTGTSTSFQRARRPEQKEQRRQDILAAASTLGARDGVRAVTLTDIAAEAGVHKSAVLRYFETREAVFLLLTAEAWQDWAAVVDEALRGSTSAGPEDAAPVTAARKQRDESMRRPTELAGVADEARALGQRDEVVALPTEVGDAADDATAPRQSDEASRQPTELADMADEARALRQRNEVVGLLTEVGDAAGEMTAREQRDESMRRPTELVDAADEMTARKQRDEVVGLRTEVGEAAGAATDRVAGVLAASLAERPLFCDLLAHAPLHLERGVSEQEVRAFKLTVLDAVDRIVHALRTALPGLTGTQAVDLVAGVTAMAAALWQTANPPKTLARLYAQDPRLGHAAVEFTPRLKRMIAMLLAGATADAVEAAQA
jgi:AcrR family transcriptional regulator